MIVLHMRVHRIRLEISLLRIAIRVSLELSQTCQCLLGEHEFGVPSFCVAEVVVEHGIRRPQKI